MFGLSDIENHYVIESESKLVDQSKKLEKWQKISQTKPNRNIGKTLIKHKSPRPIFIETQ